MEAEAAYLENRLELSYYRELSAVNEAHGVFLVQHTESRKVFVKKVLEIYDEEVYRTLMRADIPGTPHIFRILREDGRLIVLEEYITGDTLEELLSQGHSFSEEEARAIARSLCDILSALHGQDPPIIHRDIKPSNLIRTPRGGIVLLDMNAAKRQNRTKEEDTRLLGTKGYAAPEQYGFGSSGVQTDLYAVGMVLQELLGERASEQMRAILRKCTQLNPDERYASAEELKAVLSGRDSMSAASSAVPILRAGWVSFLPPGFRSLQPLPMIFSGIGYLFLFWVCLTLKIQDPGSVPALWTYRITALLMLLSVILFSGDYRGLRRYALLANSPKRSLRILGVLLTDGLILLSWALLLAVLLPVGSA